MARYPESEFSYIRFNFALTKSLQEKDQEAVLEMKHVIDMGYWKGNEKFVAGPAVPSHTE